MNDLQPKLRVLLDEGVPAEVGRAFEAHGHEVVPFEEVIKRGSQDVLVCKAALANDAILVAFDKDMRQIARQYGIGGERFKKLSLLRFSCSEPNAAKRLELAMSFVEHEWMVNRNPTARRVHVEISKGVLKSWR